MNHECLAALAGVKKRYGRIVALDELDLQVRSGELLALLGPNGAGKTTAIALLLGLQTPDSGSATLFGMSPHLLAARRHIGVMMQEVFLTMELRVREHIELVSSYYPNPYPLPQLLRLAGLESIAERPYGKLSGGQKRQAQFALAVCGRPRLLFLDEPTVGLDLRARELMWEGLREIVRAGCGVVLTTHYLEEAEALADRVAVLSQGRLIASGSVGEIRALVARKRISCETRVAAEEVATWPEVSEVTKQEQQLHITVSNAEDVVRRLLLADSNLRELEVRRAGLSEAFAELTKEAA